MCCFKLVQKEGNMRHKVTRNILIAMLVSTLAVLLVVQANFSLSSGPERKAPSHKYDLLINSYMNSGSRYTAGLFGLRKNSVYIYEPLWHFSVRGYFHDEMLVCSSTHGSLNCSTGTLENVNRSGKRGNYSAPIVKNVKKNSSIVGMMIDIIEDMFNCDFSRLEKVYMPVQKKRQPKHADQDWNDYRSCRKSKFETKMSCLKAEEKRCKMADHIVIKVLRLTTGSYDKLLERRKNVKILHLFRNPHAIINSRMETKRYPITDYNSNAAALCSKMMLDYHGSVRLAGKYPGRVKMVFYEDLKSNVTEKINKLYQYIGMHRNDKELSKLNKVKTNAFKSDTNSSVSLNRASDNSHWWRRHMSYQQYQGVHDMCKNLSSIFNLTNFQNRQELIELRIPEMNLPSALRI